MNNDSSFTGTGSVAIHGAQSGNSENAHVTPIYATSTFTFDSAEQGANRFAGTEEGYIYSRFGNPSLRAAEEVIAALEAFGVNNANGQPLQLKALLHSSGQSAMSTMFLSNLVAGDSILSHYSLYAGTHEFIYDALPRLGVNSLIANLNDLNEVEMIIKKIPH